MTNPDQEARAALPPCPFCGGEADISEDTERHPDHCWTAFCTVCDGSTGYFGDAQKAAAAWNRRQPARAERDAIKTLEKLHEGKLGAHWIWVALQQIANGQPEAQVLREYGYVLESDHVTPCAAHGCRYALDGQGLALRCAGGCSRKEGKR